MAHSNTPTVGPGKAAEITGAASKPSETPTKPIRWKMIVSWVLVLPLLAFCVLFALESFFTWYPSHAFVRDTTKAMQQAMASSDPETALRQTVGTQMGMFWRVDQRVCIEDAVAVMQAEEPTFLEVVPDVANIQPVADVASDVWVAVKAFPNHRERGQSHMFAMDSSGQLWHVNEHRCGGWEDRANRQEQFEQTDAPAMSLDDATRWLVDAEAFPFMTAHDLASLQAGLEAGGFRRVNP